MCGLQRSVQPSGQVTSSPSAPGGRGRVFGGVDREASASRRANRCGYQHCMVDDSLENRAEPARRDTIGTLATSTIDIIILFSL